MNDILGKAKSAVKLLGSASVEMMIGGIVTAVIPANVSVVYKAAVYVGSCVAAMCVSDPIDRVVDRQFDDIQAVIEETKNCVATLKQQEAPVVEKPNEEVGD